MINKNELRVLVGLSLKRRAKIYSSQFGMKVSARLVKDIYKSFGVSRQRLVTKLGNPEPVSLEQQRKEIAEAREQVDDLKKRGYDIVQLDESIFNCLKVDRVHWAPVGDPHVVARKFESRQTIALCGAISAREGLVFIASRPRSFDRAALIDVFEGIAKYYKDKDRQLKVAIYLDNCRIHKHDETLAAAERLEIPLVFCPRYRPDCNGIELLWRQAKHLFRA
jgi:hypothetical protein